MLRLEDIQRRFRLVRARLRLAQVGVNVVASSTAITSESDLLTALAGAAVYEEALDLCCRLVLSFFVHYGTKLATTDEPLIRWHHLRSMKNCKLRPFSNGCCLDLIGQYMDKPFHRSGTASGPHNGVFDGLQGAIYKEVKETV